MPWANRRLLGQFTMKFKSGVMIDLMNNDKMDMILYEHSGFLL